MANPKTGKKTSDYNILGGDYDIFEELPDGKPVWRTCVLGMKKAELKLWEMTRETKNKVFALNQKNRSVPIMLPFKSLVSQNEKPARTT